MGTQNINLSLPPYNSSNWNSPLNDNFTVLDAKAGNSLNVPLAGSDHVLATTDLQNMRINLSGAIGGSTINLIFPDAIGGSWILTNSTVSTGGNIVARTASFTQPPVALPLSGSILVYSDGVNIYSAVAGSEDLYLPLTGGKITGSLEVTQSLTIDGASSFVDVIATGLTTLLDVVVQGSIDLASAIVNAGKFTVGGFSLTGNQVFGVTGQTAYNGTVEIQSGDLNIDLGSLNVKNNAASNSLGGNTVIPVGAAFTIQKGGTFALEDGALLSILSTFNPTSISTGDLTSNTKIACTGTGGVSCGAGGIDSVGPATFEGTATFSGGAKFTQPMVVTAGLNGGTGCTFTAPGIVSAGTTQINFFPNNGTNSVGYVGSTASAAGFYDNGGTHTATMDYSTGKWTASGGVGIGLRGPVAAALAAYCPKAVYHDDGDCGSSVALEDVLVALVQELVAVRSELSAMKSR